MTPCSVKRTNKEHFGRCREKTIFLSSTFRKKSLSVKIDLTHLKLLMIFIFSIRMVQMNFDLVVMVQHLKEVT